MEYDSGYESIEEDEGEVETSLSVIPTVTTDKEQHDHNFSICNWYGYKVVKDTGILVKRCCTKCQHGSIYCSKHDSLKHDFRNCNLQESKKMCNSYQNIIITPRSYNQLKLTLTSLGYNMADRQKVYKPYETYADISESSHITLDGEETYHYNAEKNHNSTSSLRLIFKKYCSSHAHVVSNGMFFCKGCYETIIGNKIGGPTLNTISSRKALEIKITELILEGKYTGPSSTRKNKKSGLDTEPEQPKPMCKAKTKKGIPCTRQASVEEFCKTHHNSLVSYKV
jgi:hypothetical protein